MVVGRFIEANFSKLTHNNQIFRNEFVCHGLGGRATNSATGWVGTLLSAILPPNGNVGGNVIYVTDVSPPVAPALSPLSSRQKIVTPSTSLMSIVM